jgi:hypothetical protein
MMPTVTDHGIRAVSISRSGLGLCLVLLLGGFGCAPKLIGPTNPSGYRFAVIAPASILARESDEIVVHVQDAQGQKVDGVSVSFQVDPSWAGNASVTPTRTITRGGEAHTTFWAGIVGIVPIQVQVENTQHQLTIAVGLRGDVSGGD